MIIFASVKNKGVTLEALLQGFENAYLRQSYELYKLENSFSTVLRQLILRL